MAYVSPTYADFILLYPAFASVPEAQWNLFLAKAQDKVGERWLEKDYTTAQELYIAHLLEMAGLGSGAGAELNAAGLQGIRELRSGALSFSRFADQADAGVYGSLATTTYGQQFIELARLNFPGFETTAGCGVPPNHLAKDWPV